jgi:sigma-B regulation protein RsbQ
MMSFACSPPLTLSPVSTPVMNTSPMDEAQGRRVLQRHGVRIMGQGKPPMLLCNGFGCTQQIWQYLTTALAVHYQVIVFDYVGSGESDRSAYSPEKYATLTSYAHDVVEICQALDLRNAILVGHSVGATIAMLAAIQAPQHFAKTVLLAPSPCYINEPGYYGGFERDDLLQVLTAMEADYQSWTTTFADLLMGPTSMTSLREELATFFCETDSAIARQFAQVAFLADNRSDVSQLSTPTLVVQCAYDVAGPPEVGAYLLQHLPQGVLVTLRTSGHCPHLSAPLETLAAIQAFAVS